MESLNRILYPTDFSQQALVTLPLLKLLVEKFQAQLHCLHVIDEALQYWMAGADNAVPMVVSENDLIESAQKQMDEFISTHLTEFKDKLTAKVTVGRPFLNIIQYARDESIDLIVISTHGHGALTSMLLGSVTEKVVRKAPCPVLTVRNSEYKFEMP